MYRIHAIYTFTDLTFKLKKKILNNTMAKLIRNPYDIVMLVLSIISPLYSLT